ncbi:LysR family transcriptional regulator [Variovorax sp. J22R133]|uniref:LysR family transcriptional regulator n=1 Tax=Variovorax brevis TaxID=3053503 RepID=UPI002576DBDF|nr:LysR family transcriptional regulator [Variovorax sp. J22R133]MDM0110988.1 LysR family transcriptional regulator [Variovorax sp. J22R133]
MPRTEVNRSGEMEAFIQVVERGSFSAAAGALCMTPSAVSKLIARLEARLATRLVHRSTRKLQLTPEGRLYYERGVRVMADMDEAERSAAAGAAPRGRVSINASVSFGQHVLIPLVCPLLELHPQITLDIVVTDRVVDLMDERTDIAIRWGRLPPSDLVARKLGETGQAIVASPAYLARHGTPHTPQELMLHNRLGSNYRRNVPDWPLRVDGRQVDVPVSGNVRAGDGESLRRLVMSGVGLGRLSLYHVGADIEAGRLVPVMEPFNPNEVEPIHAVYLGKGGQLPARVRAVLDFLSANVVLHGAMPHTPPSPTDFKAAPPRRITKRKQPVVI